MNGSEGLAQGFGELFNRALVALVPSPVPFLLCFHQPGFLEDRHVMRNCWLGQMDPFLDIAGAQADFLAERAGISCLESL